MKKLLLLLSIMIGINCFAQDKSPILFIYDASGSMWGKLNNKTKKEIAAEVLSSTIEKLPEDQSLGLIAYGHRQKGDCDDIEYIVDLSNKSREHINKAIKDIKPLGKTPLAKSATMAINSLNVKATIILITDGIESCDGNICKVVNDAKSNGIDFKLHIVGFGLKENETEQLKCAAKAGDGKYYDARNAADMNDILSEATSQTVDKPKANFSVFASKNGSPVDAWVKAKNIKTNKTDGSRTYRDTSSIYLPPGKYEIEIRPLENSDVNSKSLTIEIKDEPVHRDISFDSGKIRVTTQNNGEGWDATVRITAVGSSKDVATARTYGKTIDLEVDPGTYDANILILKVKGSSSRKLIQNVQVKPNETTSINENFESGIAMIGVKTKQGELIDATVNFMEKTTNKGVAGARTYTSPKNNPRKFILSPGNYNVKIVTLGAHKGHSETFPLTIKAGETTEKIFTY
ncbi:MAG: VWA domain-containing protein [Flavobacteriales bacterium]|nr:VWA domain-containing protein [Flavobacteriales bacterium]